MLIAMKMLTSSFGQADFFGKLIYLGLFTLSMLCWIVLAHKIWLLNQVKRLSQKFLISVQHQKESLFSLSVENLPKSKMKEIPHPFAKILSTLTDKSLQILDKNRYFLKDEITYLSRDDVELIDTHLHSVIVGEKTKLEKNLFILPLVSRLAPFLGLLGTVWGILVTFSEMKSGGSFGSNSVMLGGLSTALVTTVMGLLIAIPSLIAYSYLRNGIKEYTSQMNDFSHKLLSTIELQYRRVDS